MLNAETIGKSADAAKAFAETGEKGIDLVGKLGRVLEPAFEPFVGMMRARANFWRLKQWLILRDRAEELMRERGIESATRALPPKFLLPFLEKATLEDGPELRELWARLLVNAADSSTAMELRVSYVSVLSELSAFDARNLAVLAAASLAVEGLNYLPVVETWHLPEYATAHGEGKDREPPPLSDEILESLGSLLRAGCITTGSGWGGVALFTLVTVTGFGRALYRAVS